MNRKVVWFICLCTFVGLLADCLFKPGKKMMQVSNSASLELAYRPTIIGSEHSSVPTPVLTQTETASDSLPVMGQTSNVISVSAPLTNEKEDVGDDKYKLLRSLRAWAAKDPEAALAAAMKLPKGDERNQALSAVCLGLAQTDPADAVKMAQTLNLGSEPRTVMPSLIQQWAANDLSSAMMWANNQPPGKQRDEFNTRIAYVMSQGDPVDAATLVINQISSGSAQNEAVMMVLHQWAKQNLVAAATWVKELPDGPLQARAVKELEGIANYQQTLAHQ